MNSSGGLSETEQYGWMMFTRVFNTAELGIGRFSMKSCQTTIHTAKDGFDSGDIFQIIDNIAADYKVPFEEVIIQSLVQIHGKRKCRCEQDSIDRANDERFPPGSSWINRHHLPGHDEGDERE